MEKLKLVYSVKAEEWLEGYDIYYKTFRRKFTYIKAAIFLIPLLLFAQQIILEPTYTMGWVCIVICIAAIACIFAMPGVERKNTERALGAIKDDKYELILTDDKLTVSTILPDNEADYLENDADGNVIPAPEIKPTVVDLKEKGLQLVETEKIIGVFTKSLSLAIPKSELNVHDKTVLRETIGKAR